MSFKIGRRPQFLAAIAALYVTMSVGLLVCWSVCLQRVSAIVKMYQTELNA